MHNACNSVSLGNTWELSALNPTSCDVLIGNLDLENELL